MYFLDFLLVVYGQLILINVVKMFPVWFYFLFADEFPFFIGLFMNKWLGYLLSIGVVATSFAASPVIKVDFDQSGRNSSEVTEANYIPWVVTGVSSKDTTLNGVKITVAKGSAGSNLKTNWYKASVQSPYYAKLVGDGILVEGGNSGGEISLTLSGLSFREHILYLLI